VTWDEIYKVALIGNFIITTGMAILVLYLKSVFVARKEFDGVAKETTQLRERVRVLETERSSAPTRKEVAEIHLGIEQLRGDVRELAAKFTGLDDLTQISRRSVERMEDFLRTQPARPARS